MPFKISKTITNDGITECFSFNILSDIDGIRIWLTDYKRKEGNRIIGKWSSFGNDGRFLKRESIDIPESVMLEVKQEIFDSIKEA